ncbi:MAG: MFS transporter [Actinobacteria bacterium]|nr:MFS transporter [Actinomycetota bacterium]
MDRRRPPSAVRLVGSIVFVEALLYAALAPLLPHYADAAHLGGAGAGVLVAAYPAGVMAGSLPAGWTATRWGARRTTVGGLLLLAVAGFAFAFADSAVRLDTARFVQGLGSAAAWTGGLAWLTAATAPDRRGTAVGSVVGISIAGTIVGPAVGVLAGAVGPEPVFGALAAIAAALALAFARGARREESSGAAKAERQRPDRGVLAGAALIAVAGTFIGVVDVVMPLRLDDLGASRVAIGLAFLVAAALQAALSLRLGRLVDRRGARPVALLCLAGTVVLTALMPLPDRAWAAALAVVVATPVVGGLWVPGMTLLGSGAAAGIESAYGFAIGNLVWSAAQALGAAGGGRATEWSGARLPFWLLAGFSAIVLLATLAVARQSSAVTSTSVP